MRRHGATEEIEMCKAFAEIECRNARQQAEMYREKAASCTYPEGTEVWTSMAELMDGQDFVWECAAR
jgi:hypothetical protein